MHTQVDPIAPGIQRLSTFVEPAGICFNQYLIAAREPFLFHCGMTQLCPLVSAAAARVLPLEELRWISFGHVEADECGAMNDWLRAAPSAQVAFGALGCMVSVADLAIRPPRPLQDGELLELGGKRLRYLATPHVPHGWDAGVFFEETTRTLLCGDLFTRLGTCSAESEEDPVGPALEGENQYGATALTPLLAPTLRRLAALEPRTLALMHGPACHGDGGRALRELADAYAERLERALARPAPG
jgi:flavorubredoxin